MPPVREADQIERGCTMEPQELLQFLMTYRRPLVKTPRGFGVLLAVGLRKSLICRYIGDTPASIESVWVFNSCIKEARLPDLAVTHFAAPGNPIEV